MMDALSTAASGMRAASRRLEASASKIANSVVAAPAADANVDLAAETIEQTTARLDFLFNLKTMEASAEMVRRLYEITDEA